MKNNDDKCFLWSVLAGLNPVAVHPDRVSHYKDFENDLNLAGIAFPVRACKRTFQRFERQNPGVALSVFLYEKGDIVPKYVDGLNSQDLAARQVDLLLLDDDGDFGHYVLVRSLSRLISSSLSEGNGSQHVCRRCLYHTRDSQKFETHRSVDCGGLNGIDGPLVVRVPDPAKEETSVSFKAYEKMMPAPYAVYATSRLSTDRWGDELVRAPSTRPSTCPVALATSSQGLRAVCMPRGFTEVKTRRVGLSASCSSTTVSSATRFAKGSNPRG